MVLLLAACLSALQDPDTPKVVERINFHRAQAGLDPVVSDPAYSQGCAAHAAYLVRNALHPSAQGLGLHNEDPNLPGYTKEGAKAGQNSDIFVGKSGAEAVDGWMASFFHRIPLLDAQLKKVGYGSAQGGPGGVVAVLDLIGGVTPGKRGTPVIYPSDGQKDVPSAFGIEIPDPIPEDPDKKAGFPITVTFVEGLSVKGVQVSLKDAMGQEIECWISTPEKPASREYQRNSVCLMAKDPLRPGTSYSVTVAGKIGGKAWLRTWTFTTGER